nr:uncharacterized protein LOC110087464 isoform X2 [Pogona vitticeps]
MPLQKERRGAKETKMYKGNLTKSAPIMLEEKPTASVEHSSAQIIKPFRKKKGARKRRVKSRPCQWRPAKTRLKIRGKRCTLQAFVNKRLPPQCREMCFSNLMQGSPPSKKTDVGWSNSPDSPSTGRRFSRKGNVGHSEQRRGFSSVQENQSRLRNPSPVAKRRYHSVSEYQFIYPGRAVFHYTKETVKQQLRSIYLGNAIQKPARNHPRPTQMPSSSWEINGSRRGNLSSTTKCPVGREFLRSIPRGTLAQGLAGLTYKIQRLVLVSNTALAEPENPPPSPTVGRKASQGQGRPASAGAKPSAEAFQRLGGCLARKRGHGWAVNQGHPSEVQGKGAAGDVVTVDAQNSVGLVSGKEGCKEASSRIYGGEDSKEEDLQREDAARSMLAVTTSSKLPATRTQQAVVIPTVTQYSSSDSENVETSSCDARSDATTFPGGDPQHVPPCETFCPSVPGEEEPAETPAGYSPEKRRSVGPFGDTERRKVLDAEMSRSP